MQEIKKTFYQIAVHAYLHNPKLKDASPMTILLRCSNDFMKALNEGHKQTTSYDLDKPETSLLSDYLDYYFKLLQLYMERLMLYMKQHSNKFEEEVKILIAKEKLQQSKEDPNNPRIIPIISSGVDILQSKLKNRFVNMMFDANQSKIDSHKKAFQASQETKLAIRKIKDIADKIFELINGKTHEKEAEQLLLVLELLTDRKITVNNKELVQEVKSKLEGEKQGFFSGFINSFFVENKEKAKLKLSYVARLNSHLQKGGRAL